MTSFWQYKLFVDVLTLFSENCRQSGVECLKSTNLQFSRCYIFASFRNKVNIRPYYALRQHPVFFADINEDDLALHSEVPTLT